MRQQRNYYNKAPAGSPGGIGLSGAGNTSAQPIVLTLQPPSSRTAIPFQGLVPQSSGGLLDILNDSDDEGEGNGSASGSSNSSGLPSPHIGALDNPGNDQKPYKIYTRSGTSPSRGASFYINRWNASPSTPRGLNVSGTYNGVITDRTPKRMKSIDPDRSLEEDPLMRSTSVPIGVSRSGMVSPRHSERGLNQLSLNSSSDEEDDFESGSSCGSNSGSVKQKIRIFVNEDGDGNFSGTSSERSSINPSGSSYSALGLPGNGSAKYFKINAQGECEYERRGYGDGVLADGPGQGPLSREEDPSQGLWDDHEWAMRICGSESDIETQVRNFRVLENSCVGSHVKDIATSFCAKRMLSEEEIQTIIRQQYEFAALLNSVSKEARSFLELTGEELFTESKSAVKTPNAGPLYPNSSEKPSNDEKSYLTDSSNGYDDFDDDDYSSPDEQ